MKIRGAQPTDWPAIGAFIASFEYFMPLDPAQLGGGWLLAVDNEDRIRGTIWYFAAAPNAYIDYWAATNSKTASLLAAFLQAVLVVAGVRYVRGMIGKDNANARRLAGRLGMAESDSDYKLIFRSL